MKKLLLSAIISIAIITCYSCNDNSTDTHTHEDGSTHADHDTTKPKQQEFVPDSTYKDSTGKEHSHGDTVKHSH